MTMTWFALNCEHAVSMLDINIESHHNDGHGAIQGLDVDVPPCRIRPSVHRQEASSVPPVFS